MHRKIPSFKAAWVLLFFFLLLGKGICAARADDTPGVQLVLVLDFPTSSDRARAAERVSQAASLLAHLLPDQVYLGLSAPGIELPATQLGAAARREMLNTLTNLKPEAPQKPLTDMVVHALTLFQPGGPEKRGLFILSAGGGAAEPQKKTSNLKEIAKMAAAARKAGVAIFAASQVAGFSSDELQALTSETFGCFWDAQTAPELITTILNFYGRLGPHQEAPISGTDFRLDPWVKQAVVVALRSAPGKAVNLITPTGARLTPRTRAKTIDWVAGQSYDLITISRPRPGVWRLYDARSADSRVFLDTELTLTVTGVPRVAGADEALPVTAALTGHEKATGGAHILSGTEYLAELQMDHGEPLPLRLQAPDTGDNSAPSPEVRVGRFSPLHQEGDATLRISALGNTCQRSIELFITITKPWYQVALPTAAAPDGPPISFQPDLKHHPQPLEGTVTVQSAQGSLAGVLLNPAPGSEIIMSPPPGCQDACLADLQLTATAPGGRHLDIVSGPRPLTVKPAAPETTAAPPGKKITQEKAQASPTPVGARKSKRRWLWLALSGIGGVFFLGAGVLFWLEGRGGHDAEEDEDPDDTSGNGDLRHQAQVDALLKEKAQLQAVLDEKKRQNEQLEKEKADLQEELARTQTRSQDSGKTLEELEKRLEEAESEAKGFQQEYMALYARSQEEKDTIKKN